MPSYFSPKKNSEYIFFAALVDSASRPDFKSSPTLAAGDFKVSTDGGALANLGTLPTVTPAASVMVKITVSAAEMNGDNVTVVCIDAAGAEWDDVVINIQTSARQIDDLAYPTVSGRSVDVAATGEVGLDLDNTVGTLSAVEIPNLDAAVSSRATPAQVNTEVLDVLNTDTFAEPPQEAPPATTTLVKKIGYLYKVFRNRITQTSTTLSVFADDGITVDQKATVSDDATTYDRNELVSGP